MLTREYRLSEKRDFQTLFTWGMYITTPLYTLRWRRNSLLHPRFGFIVANTISKKATQRNTIRRRFRECIRKHMAEFPVVADVVIIVKPKALGAPSREIEDHLLHSFRVVKQRDAQGARPPYHRPTQPKSV